MMVWDDIRTAPIGPTILLANSNTGHVVAGYGEWLDLKHVNLPRFISCDPEGFGRFKATHWMPMPDAPVPISSTQFEEASL